MAEFNPREHLIQIKNKQGSADYLPVQWRLVWFRLDCPQGTIKTELVQLDIDKEMEEEIFVWNAEKRRSEKVMKTAKGMAVFRAKIKDGKGGVATATKMEKAVSFPDFIEKAETGAIGRALAMLGYGTQFTADELDEAHRIVDAPVDRSSAPAPAPATVSEHPAITELQLDSIRKLCTHLGKSAPDDLTKLSYLAARQMIQTLTAEYREKQNRTA